MSDRIDQNILDLIPQRPPFVMIDELMYADEITSRGVFMVKEDNIFVNNNVLTEPGLIESLAQTAAAGMGYLCRSQNTPVPIGYLGSVENLEIRQLPAVGDIIEMVIVNENQVLDACIVSGTIKTRGQFIAACKMKIFLKRTPK